MTCTGNYNATTTEISLNCEQTLGASSTSPLYVQDSGTLAFGSAIQIVLLFLMVVGFVFNNMKSKKKW